MKNMKAMKGKAKAQCLFFKIFMSFMVKIPTFIFTSLLIASSAMDSIINQSCRMLRTDSAMDGV